MTPPLLDSRWWLVLAGLTLGCGGSAPAARGPQGGGGTTLVVPPPLAASGEELAAERPRLRAVVVHPVDDAKVQRAREQLDEAWQSYVAMEFEAGLETIREAVVLLESAARTQEDFDALAEAMVVRGMAEQALGREERARESLRAATRLRPELELDEGRYPPPVRELYAEMQAELRAEPASSLTVATRPAGAILFLDGEERGTAPQTLYATSGRHQLRVTAAGHAARALAVTFSPQGGQLEVDLPGADPVEAGRQMLEAPERAREETRRAWQTAFGTETVMLVAPAGEELAGTWVHLPSGETHGAAGADLRAVVDGLAEQAPVDTDGENGTARRNEGLFARGTLGILLRSDELGQDDLDGVQAGSLAGDLELSVGGSLAPGVVFGGMLALVLGGPTYELEGDPAGEPRVGPVGALGVFIAWYPSGHGGWHVYGSVGAASGELSSGNSALLEDASLGGGSLSIAGGYEWWLADEWSAGALLRLVGYRLTNGKGTNLSVGGLSLAGTVTFN